MKNIAIDIGNDQISLPSDRVNRERLSNQSSVVTVLYSERPDTCSVLVIPRKNNRDREITVLIFIKRSNTRVD